MSHIEYIHKKIRNNEIIYLYEEWRDVVVKIVPENNLYFAKFRGEQEFSIDSKSKTVVDAELGGSIITKEDYNKF